MFKRSNQMHSSEAGQRSTQARRQSPDSLPPCPVHLPSPPKLRNPCITQESSRNRCSYGSDCLPRLTLITWKVGRQPDMIPTSFHNYKGSYRTAHRMIAVSPQTSSSNGGNPHCSGLKSSRCSWITLAPCVFSGSRARSSTSGTQTTFIPALTPA
jgi:hypothetical protein